MPRRPNFGRIFKPKKKRPDGKRIEIAVWWIEFYHGGRQVRESSKSRKYKDAEGLLRQRLAELQGGNYAGPRAERVTVGELLDDLVADYETNEKSVDWCQHVCKHLRQHFVRMQAARVETRHLTNYIKKRRSIGRANGTINRELAVLKRAFNLARQATPPTVKRVPYFPHLTEPPPRSGFFEHADFTSMRRELPEHVRPIITFLYCTGCRIGEVLPLRWDQVDLVASVVRQADCTLCRAARPRLTFSRMSEAVAVQMKGVGCSLCWAM